MISFLFDEGKVSSGKRWLTICHVDETTQNLWSISRRRYLQMLDQVENTYQGKRVQLILPRHNRRSRKFLNVEYRMKLLTPQRSRSKMLAEKIGAATFSIMTLNLMTFSIMTLNLMTFSLMTLSITTFIITTFSIMTLNMKKFSMIVYKSRQSA